MKKWQQVLLLAAVALLCLALAAGQGQNFPGGGGGGGGVNAQTTNYTAVGGDSSKLITMNGSNLTLTLPNPPPSATWNVFVENLNSTSLTISRNGLAINGSAANLTLVQNASITVFTDGSNYFTTENSAGANGQVQFNNNGAFGGDPNLTWNQGGCASCLWVHGSSGLAIGGTAATNNPFLIRDAVGNNLVYVLMGTSQLTAGSFATISNCSSSASPAVCGSAPSGSVVIAAAATTVTVNTSAVTANSLIFLQEDDSLGSKLSVTCNTSSLGATKISARVAGTSFTITTAVAPTTNPACLNYWFIN